MKRLSAIAPSHIAFMLLLCGLLMVVSGLRPAMLPTADAAKLPELPPNFYAQVVTDQLELPVDLEILPSGEMFVAEKGTGVEENGQSKVKLLTGQGEPITVLTLSTNVYWDSGIVGLEIDPNFAQNHYFYLIYAAGVDALAADDSRVRLSRFTYNPEQQLVDPESERILIDNLGWYIWHHGGGMTFDDEGHLYIGVGDFGDGNLAQNLISRKGKILRIKPTENGYVIPPSNPFALSPAIPADIYAWGVRNPFRLTYLPDRDQVLVADVGNAHWEEINLVEGSANFGWPIREGACPIGQFKPCSPSVGVFTDPLYELPHTNNQPNAITGLAYYNGTRFPERFQNKLFFANYSTDSILMIDLRGVGDLVARPFATELNTPVDIVVHDGRMYVVSIERGEIIEIVYQEGGGEPQAITLTAEPLVGASPLRVDFTVSGIDNEMDEWVYVWDFGDGRPLHITPSPTVTHVYAQEGSYTAAVFARGDNGAVSQLERLVVVVYNSEIPEIKLTNLTAAERVNTFHAGDVIAYEAVRATGIEGLDPEAPYTWGINLYHDQHIHFLVRGQAAERDQITLPKITHSGSSDIYYEFELAMHTANGQVILIDKRLMPELVTVSFAYAPFDEGPLTINGVVRQTPLAVAAIVGEEQTVAAPESIVSAGKVYGFVTWVSKEADRVGEEGKLALPAEIVVTIPAVDTTYTADYLYLRPAERVWLPMVRGASSR